VDLVQAAQHARRHDPRFKTYYERVAKRGKQKAIVAVAKGMLVVIWFMLTRREPYRGQDPQLVETKLKRMNTLAHSGLTRGIGRVGKAAHPQENFHGCYLEPFTCFAGRNCCASRHFRRVSYPAAWAWEDGKNDASKDDEACVSNLTMHMESLDVTGPLLD